MYKGKVLKVRENSSVVITGTGEYLAVKNKSEMKQGDEIMFTEKDIKKKNPSYRWISIAAALMLTVLLSGGVYLNNFVTYAVVGVDINPSVELYLNRTGDVIKAKALNDDAKELDLKELKGLEAAEAINMIVDEAKELGYLVDDSYVLLTSLAMKNRGEDIIEEVEEDVMEDEDMKLVNVAIMKAEKQDYFEAQEKDVPFGMYVLNGKVETEDGYIPIREYFKDETNLEEFKNRGELIQSLKHKEKENNEVKEEEKLEEKNQEQEKEKEKEQEKNEVKVRNELHLEIMNQLSEMNIEDEELKGEVLQAREKLMNGETLEDEYLKELVLRIKKSHEFEYGEVMREFMKDAENGQGKESGQNKGNKMGS